MKKRREGEGPGWERKRDLPFYAQSSLGLSVPGLPLFLPFPDSFYERRDVFMCVTVFGYGTLCVFPFHQHTINIPVCRDAFYFQFISTFSREERGCELIPLSSHFSFLWTRANFHIKVLFDCFNQGMITNPSFSSISHSSLFLSRTRISRLILLPHPKEEDRKGRRRNLNQWSKIEQASLTGATHLSFDVRSRCVLNVSSPCLCTWSLSVTLLPLFFLVCRLEDGVPSMRKGEKKRWWLSEGREIFA